MVSVLILFTSASSSTTGTIGESHQLSRHHLQVTFTHVHYTNVISNLLWYTTGKQLSEAMVTTYLDITSLI